MIVAITGVPGTGKTTLALELSRRTGWGVVSANDLVKGKKLWTGKENGALVADLKRLGRALASAMLGKKDLILEGHLLCEIKLKVDAIVVLRTRPSALRKRLEKRGYGKAKIDENVLAEALDYCTIEAEGRYGRVYELDTTKGLKRSVSELLLIASGKGEKFSAGKVSWGKELEKEALRGDLR